MMYMDSKLVIENKIIRKERPLIPKNKLYSTYENNGVFQICFKSKGCSNYLAGYCIMCDYGVGTNLTKEEVEISFDNAIKKCSKNTKILLLNTYGSILDETEMNKDCFYALLKKIKQTTIPKVIFETHYCTITKNKLNLIRTILDNKKISIELGFETSNETIRENNLLKYIDNNKFVETIKLIHSFDISVIANLLVGIPFLTSKEQLENAIESIKWCEEHEIDEIDLFPINIKPYTLLYKLHEDNAYEIISHWLLIEVLNRVPVHYLSNIYLAWYGNRELEYNDGEHSIFPRSCELCHNNLMEFYKNFLSNNDIKYRKDLITDLISNSKCSCYQNILRKL